MFENPIFTWIGIVLCLSQSAMFSGLNLAFFSLSRLRLEAEAEDGNVSAKRILRLRSDANFLLCTILWGNVSVNVLLALLSESALNGLWGFVLSTFGITFFGEIIPQAYFSRNAMKMGALLAPIIRFYQILLYPFAKVSAIILDAWIGPEGPNFMRERDVEIILQKHISEEDSEIGATEGRGALNFLDLDDRLIANEGKAIEPATVFTFATNLDLPTIPQAKEEGADAFLDALKATEMKRAIICDIEETPLLVLDIEPYLCHLFANRHNSSRTVYEFCHRPIIVEDPEATVDSVLSDFTVEAEHKNDHIIDRDVILFWPTEGTRRILTGADILGRLMRGIAKRTKARVENSANA